MHYCSKKYFLLLSLFISLISSRAQEGEARIVEAGDTGLEQLEKLTETEPIKGYLEDCKASDPEQKQAQLMECTWNKLEPGEKEEVYALLNSNSKDSDLGSDYDIGLSNFKKEKSSAAKVLENYLVKRLEEALYGKEDEGNLKVARDHTQFYRIYQSQLGKNLISELSAFCIYSSEDGTIPYDKNEELKKNKERNLENLNKIDETTGKSSSYSSYEKCIGSIGQSCEDGKNFKKDFSDAASSPCELNRLMTSAKIAIDKTTDLVNTFRTELEETSKDKNLGNNFKLNASIKGEKAVTINQKDIGISEIINIGSKELIKDSGYEEALKKTATEIEENCAEITDAELDPNCSKYLTKKSDNDALSLEFAIRNKALTEKVKDRLTEPTEENLKAVLQEQGLDIEKGAYEALKASVAKGLEDGSSSCKTVEECIKDKIIKRYESEREQLTSSLQKKLEETQYDDSKSGTTDASSTLSDLSEKYKSAPESLASVYQYANIVSSFIDIESEDTEKSNTAALAAELNSNYFSADVTGRQTSSEQTTTVRDLSTLSELATDEDSNDKNPVFLDSSKINTIQGWD